MSEEDYRKESDSMGELKVPSQAQWGAQTQRAIENFQISDIRVPRKFISALGLVKWSAASTNEELGLLKKEKSIAIKAAAQDIIDGKYDSQFPVDIFQTGSGTSSNMNANEVIANIALSTSKQKIHPNDDVNMCQSSNDVIPTAINIAVLISIEEDLLPSIDGLIKSLSSKSNELKNTVKTGRTHLMDAMPITMGQEIGGWKQQMKNAYNRIDGGLERLSQLAQGGTAVGTGVNAHQDFGKIFVSTLSKKTGKHFKLSASYFESLSSQDTSLEISSYLRSLAVSLLKISNDLRWMNSGPLSGIGEIKLPELQPGSSIMPGKVNPVIPEAIAMAAAQVIGNDTTVTIAAQSGNFQLNVMLPIIAHNLLESIHILTNSIIALNEKAIIGFEVNYEKIKANLDRNPILVTALNSIIGYELGAKIAKTAYREKRSVRDVAIELTDLSEAELERILDPSSLTEGGLKNK